MHKSAIVPVAVCHLLMCSVASAQTAVSHWAWQQRSRPAIPSFADQSDRAWVANPVDAFVLQALKDRGLEPAPRSKASGLVRRLYFDLTGLPPTPEEVERYLMDKSESAWERLVDRLLASPRYGQRWGQHWLDVARFADTEGYEYDRHRTGSWRYRDYVIQALNRDMPYNQFVTEQLAGDEIQPLTTQGETAVGFLRAGPIRRNAGNQKVAFSRNEVLTEMTDTLSAVFLSLTMGCARCHDHKFDPIQQKDYYQLQAFLASTYEFDKPLASDQEQSAWERRANKVKQQIAACKKRLERASGEEAERLEAEIEKLEDQLPDPLPALFTVRDQLEEETPIHLLKRGDPDQPAELLDRQVPGFLAGPDATERAYPPRAALAMWITDPHNPMTARTIVNRIWQYHFGRGIVSTPNDFGINGGRPSHPELLDYLAGELIRAEWSLKAVHRLICTSSTYRQSSSTPQFNLATRLDPDNRLLWHMPQRRLEAEELRDAMLSVAGQLNFKPGGPGVIVPVDQTLVDLLYKPSQWQVTVQRSEHYRRSIYLIAKRNLRVPMLEVFDQPDLQTSCARRESSTHAPQALELLNGTFSNEMAEHFANRLLREAGKDQVRQVELAFLLATGRTPSAEEHRLAGAFLQEHSLREFALAVFNLNAFLYVN